MKISFTTHAWEDYTYWAENDRKMVKRINKLIDDTKGIGKPEPLKGDLSGYWSRRIDDTHRLVYRPTDDELIIVQARYHY
ncbi:Txe/YoeB family addiction module toxin [Streptomyces sp. NPDC014006]|uniref:Txe/YoeB family addiction module toxin n=1 Tax=Streptomyces sp. NPDC014006 TaxID=3364870 RepID=UPI0036FA0604